MASNGPQTISKTPAQYIAEEESTGRAPHPLRSIDRDGASLSLLGYIHQSYHMAFASD